MPEQHEECTCGGIPEGAVVTNVLEVEEYLHPETGELWRADFSHDSAGGDLDHGKLLELCEWARMMREAPILADMVCSYLHDDED